MSLCRKRGLEPDGRLEAREVTRRSHDGDLWIEAPGVPPYREDRVNEDNGPVHDALLHSKKWRM